MTPERYKQVDELFQAALERPHQERAVFLDQVCSNDPDLRREVEVLLVSDEQASSLIESPAFELAPELLADKTSISLIGQAIGPYRLTAHLGSGGMGEVYLAQDTRLGRRVALKLLGRSLIGDPASRARFLREARLASALDHSNICTIFEVGEDAGQCYIAMQYVEGQTLNQIIDGKPLALDNMLSISLQVADALQAAHAQGIIHRDIKSSNIIVTPRGQAKVLDFGLARAVEKEAAQQRDDLTRTGAVIGTPAYMSPEQARGERVDVRSDIFSFGVVMYEMAAGEVPFKGGSQPETMNALINQPHASLAQLNRAIPEQLVAVIDRTLSKQADDRYQAIEALISDLRRTAKAAGLAQEFATPVPIPAYGSESLMRRFKRGKTVVVVAGFIVLAVLATFLALYLRAGSDRQAGASPPPAQMTLRRFTTHGGVPARVAISPDGKTLVYSQRIHEKASLWLGQIETNSSLPIIQQPGLLFDHLVFTPDGSSVYFNVSGENHPKAMLVRMPVLGGVMTELIPAVLGPVTFSPDGKTMAFLGRDSETKKAAIILADAVDGKNQRTLIAPGQPEGISGSGLSWSPDGKTIAFGAFNTSGREELKVVSVPEGSVSRIGSRDWRNLLRVAWLPDGNGLLVLARENVGERQRRIWLVSYPGGEARQITNDLNNFLFDTLSVSRDGKLAVLQGHINSEIWIAPQGDAKEARRILQGVAPRYEGVDGLAWTPDGRLLYTAYVGDSRVIWSINSDGTDLRQLTPTRANASDANIRVSADGRYVVFESNRSGAAEIWRVNPDGSNLKQLTSGGDPSAPGLSPDGQWVVYAAVHDRGYALWRISIDGGEPAQIPGVPASAIPTRTPVQVSPDGLYIGYLAASPLRLVIIPSGGGEPVRSFPAPRSTLSRLAWTPDGKAIVYRDEPRGLRRQSLDEQRSQPVKGFEGVAVRQFAWSFDVKSLAYTSGEATHEIILIENFR